jgi:hypothetical protein
MNLSGRVSPSGPKVELQLPYYAVNGLDGTAPGVYNITLFQAVINAGDQELESAYLILQRGTLGTLLIKNVQVGADAVNLTYRARKNGANTGNPVIIGNNAVGPVRVDLSGIGLSEGDTVSLQVTIPAFAGAPPIPKIGFTWFPIG